jgi:hypothetical protein
MQYIASTNSMFHIPCGSGNILHITKYDGHTMAILTNKHYMLVQMVYANRFM